MKKAVGILALACLCSLGAVSVSYAGCGTGTVECECTCYDSTSAGDLRGSYGLGTVQVDTKCNHWLFCFSCVLTEGIMSGWYACHTYMSDCEQKCRETAPEDWKTGYYTPIYYQLTAKYKEEKYTSVIFTLWLKN